MKRKMSSPSRPASVAEMTRRTARSRKIRRMTANCAAPSGKTESGHSAGNMGSSARRQAFQRGSIWWGCASPTR